MKHQCCKIIYLRKLEYFRCYFRTQLKTLNFVFCFTLCQKDFRFSTENFADFKKIFFFRILFLCPVFQQQLKNTTICEPNFVHIVLEQCYVFCAEFMTFRTQNNMKYSCLDLELFSFCQLNYHNSLKTRIRVARFLV